MKKAMKTLFTAAIVSLMAMVSVQAGDLPTPLTKTALHFSNNYRSSGYKSYNYSSSKKKDKDDCNHKSCTKNKISGSSFCRSHTCKEIGCMNEVPAANERCSLHKSEYYNRIGVYGNKKTYSTPKKNYSYSYSRNSSSKKKTDPYNAAEYSDYEDFYYDHIDDFEGIDDAESYYEEHCE